MSQLRPFYLLKDGQRKELSNGDRSGAVYMAIWDWCAANWIWMSVFLLPRRRGHPKTAPLLEGERGQDLHRCGGQCLHRTGSGAVQPGIHGRQPDPSDARCPCRQGLHHRHHHDHHRQGGAQPGGVDIGCGMETTRIREPRLELQKAGQADLRKDPLRLLHPRLRPTAISMRST